MFIFNIKNQLRTLLEGHDLGKYLRSHHKQSNGLWDISDGSLYRMFANGKLLLDRFGLSLLITTDGVPVFNSSNVSMWPASLMINELPAKMKKKFLMLIALWLGKGKPNCKLLFENLVDQIKLLSQTGFQWTFRNKKVSSTVDVIAVIADSVARAPIQNCLQFNGFFGCSWCEDPGQTYNHTHVYKFDRNSSLRTKESVEEFHASNSFHVYLEQKKICPAELYEARKNLRLFVERFELLYGLGNMTFNVHQLLHVCDCVGSLGPLWGYSAYSFEDLYGKMMKMFNGSMEHKKLAIKL